MNLLTAVRSLVFPTFCRICSNFVEDFRNGPACEKCWSNTVFFGSQNSNCYKCDRYHSEQKAGVKIFCHECDDDLFDLARACGPYGDALAATVLSLKSTPVVPQRVVNYMFERFAAEAFEPPDLIIPIPLSKRRMSERGFNQAEIIANRFSKLSGIPLDIKSLLRSKHTVVSRASMDRKGREMTVRNAFRVKRSNLVQGRKILVIDDVLTSGSTASMAAKALKKSGAERVEVLTIARAG